MKVGPPEKLTVKYQNSQQQEQQGSIYANHNTVQSI